MVYIVLLTAPFLFGVKMFNFKSVHYEKGYDVFGRFCKMRLYESFPAGHADCFYAGRQV